APAPALLRGVGDDGTHLLVVCTAERGLCGAFNSSIARLARDKATALMADGKAVKFLCVGKKGYDLLKRQFGRQILEVMELRGIRQLGFENADPIGRKIIELFDKSEFSVCTLFFSRFRSVIVQIPTALRIIPVQVSEGTRSSWVYDFEPEPDELLSGLLPRNISVQVFRALLENAASEQGARMSAMDNATRNAGEMIKKQTLKYNRTRQAMITKELIEIISGAEAL
ncbi:MAG: F0F1 ATP synthase subunit gamma, partial [Methylovirgula sp.]